VQEIDGNNMQAIIDAVNLAKGVFEKPSVIIARTIPGKGVREFERKFEWHGKAPNKEEATLALDELRTLGGKIKSEHK
jgi:transketolase